MALEHAILVSLTERAASGYDLARRFDASIGFFWPASHQQIYKVLGRMQADGWVESTTLAQAGKPDKKTYSITDTGRAELTRWGALASPREAVRSDFAVKLRAFIDPAALREDTQSRLADHRARLEGYLASAERFYPEPGSLKGADLGGWLALRGGILTEEQGIAWCEEILTALAERESR